MRTFVRVLLIFVLLAPYNVYGVDSIENLVDKKIEQSPIAMESPIPVVPVGAIFKLMLKTVKKAGNLVDELPYDEIAKILKVSLKEAKELTHSKAVGSALIQDARNLNIKGLEKIDKLGEKAIELTDKLAGDVDDIIKTVRNAKNFCLLVQDGYNHKANKILDNLKEGETITLDELTIKVRKEIVIAVKKKRKYSPLGQKHNVTWHNEDGTKIEKKPKTKKYTPKVVKPREKPETKTPIVTETNVAGMKYYVKLKNIETKTMEKIEESKFTIVLYPKDPNAWSLREYVFKNTKEEFEIALERWKNSDFLNVEYVIRNQSNGNGPKPPKKGVRTKETTVEEIKYDENFKGVYSKYIKKIEESNFTIVLLPKDSKYGGFREFVFKNSPEEFRTALEKYKNSEFFDVEHIVYGKNVEAEMFEKPKYFNNAVNDIRKMPEPKIKNVEDIKKTVITDENELKRLIKLNHRAAGNKVLKIDAEVYKQFLKENPTFEKSNLEKLKDAKNIYLVINNDDRGSFLLLETDKELKTIGTFTPIIPIEQSDGVLEGHIEIKKNFRRLKFNNLLLKEIIEHVNPKYLGSTPTSTNEELINKRLKKIFGVEYKKHIRSYIQEDKDLSEVDFDNIKTVDFENMTAEDFADFYAINVEKYGDKRVVQLLLDALSKHTSHNMLNKNGFEISEIKIDFSKNSFHISAGYKKIEPPKIKTPKKAKDVDINNPTEIYDFLKQAGAKLETWEGEIAYGLPTALLPKEYHKAFDPKLNKYMLLGEGYDSFVYRVIPNNGDKTFIIKIFKDEEIFNIRKNQLNNYKNFFENENLKGIRTINILEENENILFLEDVKGISLEKTITEENYITNLDAVDLLLDKAFLTAPVNLTPLIKINFSRNIIIITEGASKGQLVLIDPI